MASTVTDLNPAPLGCGGTRDLHYDRAAMIVDVSIDCAAMGAMILIANQKRWKRFM